MPVFGKEVAGGIASIAALTLIPSLVNMVRVNTRWERRMAVWKLENPTPVEFYSKALGLYTKLGYSLVAVGRGPLTAAPFEMRTLRWLTLKEVAQDLIGRKLPDIKPADAIKLGKSSPFPAEIWWRGCTDRSKWDYANA